MTRISEVLRPLMASYIDHDAPRSMRSKHHVMACTSTYTACTACTAYRSYGTVYAHALHGMLRILMYVHSSSVPSWHGGIYTMV
jgi:hypothetical protein